MPKFDGLSCPYCGRTSIRWSGRRADYEVVLPYLGVGRLRCKNCEARFYRFWGLWSLRAPERPPNLLMWSAVLLVAGGCYLYLWLRH